MTIGNTIALGPLVLSTDRLLAMLAIASFIGLMSFLTRKSLRPSSNAATAAVVAGLVMGRIGYVAMHIPSFSDDPLSALAIWQGGFSMIAGIVGAALVLVVTLRRSAALYRSLTSQSSGQQAIESSVSIGSRLTNQSGCMSPKPNPTTAPERKLRGCRRFYASA